MMKCKQFVFLTSSDQWPHTRWATRLDGRLHRLMCTDCRSFDQNDQALKKILLKYREQHDKHAPS